MYNTKKIGLFVSHIFGRYQTELCQGIIDAAAKCGYHTEIFISTDGENLGNYDIGEDSILRIPSFDQLCAVVFVSGTYLCASLKEKVAAALKERCHCPVLEINRSSTDFPCLTLDNNTPFRQLTAHLLSVHRCRRICYLGDSANPYFSGLRRAAYEAAMQACGLTANPQDIRECADNYDEISSALHDFLEGEVKPDAIVCYNDGMALSMLHAILDRGLRVPQDILLTGCDDLPLARDIRQKLTTISFPMYELGQKAVDLLLKMLDGETPEPTTILTAEPIYAVSCGCADSQKQEPFFLTNRLANQIEQMENYLVSDIYMSARLHGATDIDTAMDLLEESALHLPYCKELYICLYHDWDKASSQLRELTAFENSDEDFLDHKLLTFAMKDGKRLPECSFTRQNVLPEYLYSDTSSYLFQPLYFEEREFGYLAIAFPDNRINYPFYFIGWLRNVNTMLQSIVNATHMGILANRLENIYLHDELTGLYNRRGFFVRKDLLTKQAQRTGESLLAVTLDLDGLKAINDAFGRREGNFALQVVGHAIESTLKEDDICARIDGDEFYILGCGYNDSSANSLIDRIHQYLDNYNRLHTRKYTISVSAGYALAKADASLDIENLFDTAERLI